MAVVRFEQVLADVQALTPAEQQQLQAWLATRSAPPPLTEEAFAAALCAAGLLNEVKPPLTDFTPYQHREPITTTGQPLSEILIEERR